MKKNYFLFLTISIVAINSINQLEAQAVSKRDSLALVNLYDSTSGYNWRHNKNWLTGPVSTWYGITVVDTSVTEVVLGTNGLHGILPLSIGDLSNLNTLYLNDNGISGTIPETIGNLTNLQYLSFYHNNLKGAIPATIGNCSNLLQFDVRYNQLEIIPASLCHCTNLYWLYLNNNNFKSLPDSIGNLKRLFFLDASYNDLNKTIPQSIGDLSNLIGLDLSVNHLTGAIPESIGNLDSVTSINLRHNNLTGGIPSSTGKLLHLQYLDLSNNSLNNNIPEALGNLSDIKELYLNDNNLTGQIPSSIGRLDSIEYLYLYSNKLTGNIPASLATLKNAYDINLDNNQLTGSIPATFASPDKHVSLNVSYNHLSEDRNIDSLAFQNKNFYASIDHNWFTFDGIEFIAGHFPLVSYAPQAKVNIHQHKNALAVNAGGTLSNNTYTWFKIGQKGNKTIVGDSLFHPSQSGLYYAEVTNSIAAKLILRTDTLEYTILSTISGNIYSTNLDKKLVISPNPAQNILHVEGLSSRNAKLTVVDFNGNVKLQAVANASSYNINIASLYAGNYLLKIETNGEVVTKQFVKE